MAIGVAAAIIGVAAGLCAIVAWIIKEIKDNKLKRHNREIFYTELTAKYKIHTDIDCDDVCEKLKSAITHIILSQNVHPDLLKEFGELKKSFRDAIGSSSVWLNGAVIEGVSCNSSSLSRHEISYDDKGFMDIKISSECPFLLKAKCHQYFFYPCFVIAEVNCQYKIIDYRDINIKNNDSIYVTEQSGRLIRGASPAFYNYLHQRVDGGPDRRYKNNPATPVYNYEIFRLIIGNEIQIIMASNDAMNLFVHGLRKYRNAIVNYPIQESTQIKDINIASNEYASQLREIISEHGKDIITQKTFINLLKDYKFPKEYPHLIPIYEMLQDTNHMHQIIKCGFTFSELDEIKEQIIKNSPHPESDVNTALAFLGYGLQIPN